MSSAQHVSADTASTREWRGMQSQVHRQQWESQWMAQLGAASKVIEHDPRESVEPEAHPALAHSGAGVWHDVSVARHGDEMLGQQGVNGGSVAAPSGEWATYSGRETAGADRATIAPAMRGQKQVELARSSFSGPLPSAPQVGADHAQLTSATISGADKYAGTAHGPTAHGFQATSATPGPQGLAPPKHFALWRNDDSVRFAMRTREPEKAGEIISVLRGWLRAAGLSLRDVWINGRNHHGS